MSMILKQGLPLTMCAPLLRKTFLSIFQKNQIGTTKLYMWMILKQGMPPCIIQPRKTSLSIFQKNLIHTTKLYMWMILKQRMPPTMSAPQARNTYPSIFRKNQIVHQNCSCESSLSKGCHWLHVHLNQDKLILPFLERIKSYIKIVHVNDP